MNLRTLGLSLGIGLVGCLSGCLGRSLPTPPPGATIEAITQCEPTECPNGGVIVSLSGTAMPGAQVIVEDLNPATVGPRGELLGRTARGDERTGAWFATLSPEHDRMTGAVRAVQRGDTLSIYQISPAPDSQPSAAVFIVVPER